MPASALRAGAVRAGLIAAGLCLAAWSAATLPPLLRESALRDAGDRIAGGETFRPAALAALAETDAVRTPSGVRALALVRLQLAEQAIAGRPEAGDGGARLAELRPTLDRALAADPNDAFLWLALYWSDLVRKADGAVPDPAPLRRSYATGPREGWIAAKRNPIALAERDSLPPDIVAASEREFVGIVASRMPRDGVASLRAAAPALRPALAASLAPLPESTRKEFATTVSYYNELADIRIPGFERDPRRPWR